MKTAWWWLSWVLRRSAGALCLTVSLAAVGQVRWHFEFEAARPVRLVWETQPGQSCDLYESGELTSWEPVPGFPRVATGTREAYSFEPGPRRFFQIRCGEVGVGGWQPAVLPGLSGGDIFDLSAVSALGATPLWLCGTVRPGGDACVLRSDNGGADWELTCRASGVGFFGDLQMASAEVGYVAGSGLRRTGDGGNSWEPDQGNQPDPPGVWHAVGPDGYVYGMAVVDVGHVWTAGYDGASAGVIYHRVPERAQPDPAHPNGNTPWWLEWAQERQAMYGMSAVGRELAWAVGYGGAIWRTRDGASWEAQVSGTGVSLQDVDAVDAGTVWVVGDGGTILKTSNGGTNWIPQVAGTAENLWRVAAVDAEVAWVVGGGGVILHTVDGGETWTRQLSGTSAILRGVAAVDRERAWVVGDGNTVLRTTDGGEGAWLAPAVSSVVPNVVGADSWPPMVVTLTGTGFRGGNLEVAFGGVSASVVEWISGTTVRATVPTRSAGTVNVTLTNEDGQQATLARGVTFVPQPRVTRYTPLHGPAAGGYAITVEGFSLQSIRGAQIQAPGEEPEALAFQVIDSTRVLVTVPESGTRSAGRVWLLLETEENQSVGAGEFLLDPEGGPVFAVHAITPAAGAPLTTVKVTGVGFGPAATLELCGRNVPLTSRSSTELVGQVSGDPGVGRLVLMNDESDGISVDPAFLLVEGEVPVLAQVAPTSGPAAGGILVTLTGTGFAPSDTVTFDGYTAEITSWSSTSMEVILPPHAPGSVSVLVLSEDLRRSAAVLPGGFTYH